MHVLTVFIDGLRHDCLADMPFLSRMATTAEMRTLMGYSLTCHASMYSGVYPDRHHVWFSWQHRPEESPYTWIPDCAATGIVDSLPTRLLFGKAARAFSGNTSYGGLPIMKRSTLRYWRYLAYTERRMCHEQGYLALPTVFQILDDHAVTWEAVGLLRADDAGGKLKHIETYRVPSPAPSWTYLFIGELDSVSHFDGPLSESAKLLRARIDAQVERVFHELRAACGEEPVLMCFSDHGHIPVEEKLNAYEVFAAAGHPLDRFLHVVDSNYLRLWFRDDTERQVAHGILEAIEGGWFLTLKELRRRHLAMPDHRYGHAIFYLDSPRMFQRTVWGYGYRTVSMHGYSPDHPESTGVYVSNRPRRHDSPVELVDVLPSLLEALDLPVPADLDGSSVW